MAGRRTRILIAGADGKIARDAADALRRLGYDVLLPSAGGTTPREGEEGCDLVLSPPGREPPAGGPGASFAHLVSREEYMALGRAARTGPSAADCYVVADACDAALAATVEMALRLGEARRAEAAREQALAESEARFATFMENLPAAAFVKDARGRTLFVNRFLARLLGFPDWRGKTTEELIAGELGQAMAEDDRRALEGGPIQVQEAMAGPEGPERVFETVKFPIRSPGKEPLLGGISVDITDRIRAAEGMRIDEARLESLVRIGQRPTSDVQELLDYALEEAIALTGSRIGYIYRYDEGRREFTLNSWSREVMRQCTVAEPQTVYKLEKTGIWGEAVRQRKPILRNDFAAPDPLKKGLPPGHAPLRRFLTAPVLSEGRIVAVIGVGNKEGEYVEADVRQLVLMMDSVWKIVQRKDAEDELRRREARIRELLEEKLTLLREVHHRIGNYMNTMQALLSFQAEACGDPRTEAALRDAAGRVDGMRFLYEKLYRSERSEPISLRDYLPELAAEIIGLFPPKTRLRVEAQVEDIVLDPRLLSPIGIIVNEIVTNSLKHAFPGRAEGRILISARRAGGSVRLEVGDDGVGMSAGAVSEGEDSTRFGLRLLSLMVGQLKGGLERLEGPGTRYAITFPA